MTDLCKKILGKFRRDSGRPEIGQRPVARRRLALLAVLVLVGVIIGAALYYQLKTEATAAAKEPDTASLVRQVTEEKKVYWNQPAEGLLGGRVTGQDDAGFVLEDATGVSWYVSTTETTPGLEYAQFLQRVRVTGEKGEDGYFIAKEIQPWEYQR
jgi:hypothetical protein